MNPLEPPDSFHLSAAEGWLELGNPAEALAELDLIQPAHLEQPAVLRLRWRAAAAAGAHEEAVRVANRVIAVAPDDPFGWVHRAFSLHELKRTREAYEALIPVVTRFPHDYVIPYNLACYSCQLGDLEEARQWLRHAIVVGGLEKIRELASDDPDLAPLAGEI